MTVPGGRVACAWSGGDASQPFSRPCLVLVLVVVGLVFAGSSDRIAAGVTVAGAEVAGLSLSDAENRLATRAEELAAVPVTFTAGGYRWRATAEELGVTVDWGETLARARDAGAFPPPFRGLKRILLRFLGTDVQPVASAYEAGLTYELGQVAAAVEQSPRDAAIELDGKDARIVPSATGVELDVEAGARNGGRDPGRLLARACGAARCDGPAGGADRGARACARAGSNGALRARPVWLGRHALEGRARRRSPSCCDSRPSGGRSSRSAAPTPTRTSSGWRRPSTARRSMPGSRVRENRKVRVVPADDGRVLDVDATSEALLAAALSTTRRRAELVVVDKDASFTTKEAEALGIERELARYTVGWSGDANRIQNLRRAGELLDGTRLAPGATFSFNEVVGERTIARGFLPAPVIVGGKYETGVGGGVSQVATTIFNAAWEAGLPIVDRTAHALYISRYEAGRDATVNYPDIDFKFENDTERWLVVRTFISDVGLSIGLLGVPDGRRVVSEAGPLRVVGQPKVRRVRDRGLLVGERMIEDFGEPARSITVRRIVYQRGEILYDENWYTYYRSEPKIVHVGTIPVPEPEPVPEEEPTPTGTTPTTTGQTGTGGTGTGQTTTGGNGN